MRSIYSSKSFLTTARRDMSINDRNSNHKLIDIIRLSERLSSFFQNVATETRSRITSLEISIVIILFRPLPISTETVLTKFLNIEMVLKEFSDINFKIRLKRPTLQENRLIPSNY